MFSIKGKNHNYIKDKVYKASSGKNAASSSFISSFLNSSASTSASSVASSYNLSGRYTCFATNDDMVVDSLFIKDIEIPKKNSKNKYHKLIEILAEDYFTHRHLDDVDFGVYNHDYKPLVVPSTYLEIAEVETETKHVLVQPFQKIQDFAQYFKKTYKDSGFYAWGKPQENQDAIFIWWTDAYSDIVDQILRMPKGDRLLDELAFIIAISAIRGDYSTHLNNIAFELDAEGEILRVVKIDHGGALRNYALNDHTKPLHSSGCKEYRDSFIARCTKGYVEYWRNIPEIKSRVQKLAEKIQISQPSVNQSVDKMLKTYDILESKLENDSEKAGFKDSFSQYIGVSVDVVNNPDKLKKTFFDIEVKRCSGLSKLSAKNAELPRKPLIASGMMSALLEVVKKAMSNMKMRKVATTKKYKVLAYFYQELQALSSLTGDLLKQQVNMFERIVTHKRYGFRFFGGATKTFQSVQNDLDIIKKQLDVSPSLKASESSKPQFTFKKYFQKNKSEIAHMNN